MAEREGIIVNFEGGDGSGKGTHTRLAYEWMLGMGVFTRQMSFPRYHTPTGARVGRYLREGNPDNLDAHQASMLYVEDRLAARDEILEWQARGGSQLFDRYVHSNMGHQGGKLETDEERLRFFEEMYELEFGTNQLPIPDKTILFPMPAELAQAYVDRKLAASRSVYTDQKRDSHEADPNHLRRANESFLLLAQSRPDEFVVIDPVNETRDAMRPIMEIHMEVTRALRPLLEMRSLIQPNQPDPYFFYNQEAA